jgi:hypothetical protein
MCALPCMHTLFIYHIRRCFAQSANNTAVSTVCTCIAHATTNDHMVTGTTTADLPLTYYQSALHTVTMCSLLPLTNTCTNVYMHTSLFEQYLDLIMLLNGYKEPVLYKVSSTHMR